MTLAQISHTTLSLIKSLVFAIGWTGRCCLYPLVSRGNCRWLGTVSFTTNLCCLQPKAPNRHRCFRIFECTPVAFIAGRFLPFLFTRVLCSLWKYHRAPTIAFALRLEGMNCLAQNLPYTSIWFANARTVAFAGQTYNWRMTLFHEPAAPSS